MDLHMGKSKRLIFQDRVCFMFSLSNPSGRWMTINTRSTGGVVTLCIASFSNTETVPSKPRNG
jgi:hypothetical protein